MGDNLSSRYYRYCPVPVPSLRWHGEDMAKKQTRRPNFIRQWRKFRKMTQQELADKLGIAQGSLSDLENSQYDYVQSTLERVAKALRCEPSDLIGRPPDQSDIFREIIGGLDEKGRKRALALLQALREADVA